MQREKIEVRRKLFSVQYKKMNEDKNKKKILLFKYLYITPSMSFPYNVQHLKHLLDKLVDLVSLLTASTTFVEVIQLLTVKSASWRSELHWPQKVGDSLEVRTNSEDFVNDIFNALDTMLSQTSLDNSVGAERNSLTVNLAVAALVDKVADRLQTWVTIGDEWFDQSEHLDGGSIDANEDTVVDLAQAEKLQDLLHLW